MGIRKNSKTWLLAAIGMLLLSAVPARASLVAAVQFVGVGVGSTGNPLQITLQNTGASPVTIAAFSFLISTTDTDITFTGSDFNTAPNPYIFAADSQDQSFLFTLNTLPPGQSMDGLDASNNNGDVVAAGATVGLGRILFDVSPTAVSGAFAVTLATDTAHTSLTGPAPAASNIPIDTFTNGQITVNVVPEPSSGVLLAGALAGIAMLKMLSGVCLALRRRLAK